MALGDGNNQLVVGTRRLDSSQKSNTGNDPSNTLVSTSTVRTIRLTSWHCLSNADPSAAGPVDHQICSSPIVALLCACRRRLVGCAMDALPPRHGISLSLRSTGGTIVNHKSMILLIVIHSHLPDGPYCSFSGASNKRDIRSYIAYSRLNHRM